MNVLDNLQPSAIWKYFEEVTRVPRPSKHEEKIIKYLEEFARAHSLDHKKDEAGNILIIKNATAGMENRPTVAIQSHMDMVCEKNSDTVFDFDNEPIRVQISDGWVCADGTTLGADCGIGIAAQLALLASNNIDHPRIEALFTVDEETGLTGAFALKSDMLTAQYLINVDSEDEGEVFIGCAGGVDTIATLPFKWIDAPKDYTYFRIEIGSLLGGHSGDDIEKGRANSNKIAARFIWAGLDKYQLTVSDINGGNLRNAIPREAYAVVGVPEKFATEFENSAKELASKITQEFHYTEPQMKILVLKTTKPTSVIDHSACENLTKAILGIPNGVIAMSFAMPGLVETSSNLASIKIKEDKIELVSSQRSSIESAKWAAAYSAESVFALAGAEVHHSEGYPGWAPNPSSPLLATTVECYKNLFGIEPKVRAIHAGLECGLFLEKYPQMDMVSFGPTLRGVHSPTERLEIVTVDKFWKLLLTTIQNIK